MSAATRCWQQCWQQWWQLARRQQAQGHRATGHGASGRHMARPWRCEATRSETSATRLSSSYSRGCLYEVHTGPTATAATTQRQPFGRKQALAAASDNQLVSSPSFCSSDSSDYYCNTFNFNATICTTGLRLERIFDRPAPSLGGNMPRLLSEHEGLWLLRHMQARRSWEPQQVSHYTCLRSHC